MKIKNKIKRLFNNYFICSIVIFSLFFIFTLFSYYLKSIEKKFITYKYKFNSFHFYIDTVLENKKNAESIIASINSNYPELKKEYNRFISINKRLYHNNNNLENLRYIEIQQNNYFDKITQITDELSIIKDYQLKSEALFKNKSLSDFSVNPELPDNTDKDLYANIILITKHRSEMNSFYKIIINNLTELENNVISFLKFLRITVLIIISIISILLFTLVFSKNIFDLNKLVFNFKKLSQLVNKLANNDYNVSFNLDSEDELSNIALNIKYVIQLNDILIDLKNLINLLSDKFNNVKEISNKSVDIILNEKSYEDKLVSSFDNFKESLSVISDNSLKINLIVLETKNKTQSSNIKIKEAIDSIKILSETSSKITGILKIINSITEQTELLSLSASIEAARAGESGKGFLIVANEIKKLADSTIISTKEIALFSRKIIQIIKKAAGKIDPSYESLNTIQTGVFKLVDYINEITSISEDNTSKSETLTNDISSIKDQTNNNMILTDKINQQSVVLKSKIDHLLDVISKIKISKQMTMTRKIRLAE